MDLGRVVVTAVVLTALSACGGSSDNFVRDRPDGTDEVVLRMDVGGGFVPVDWVLGHIPTFTLYGDGTILTEGPQIAIYPPPALPNVVMRQVSDDAVERILRAARDAGLTGPDRSYTTSNIADAATTTFTLHAGGEDHRTDVYALGEEEPFGASDDERAARRALARLRTQLTDLERWIPAEQLGDEEAFEPEALRIYVRPYDERAVPDDLPQPPKDWPLAEPLATFGDAGDHARCGTVAGEEAQQVLAAAREANALTPWRSDGESFLLVFRPLLPDESGC